MFEEGVLKEVDGVVEEPDACSVVREGMIYGRMCMYRWFACGVRA